MIVSEYILLYLIMLIPGYFSFRVLVFSYNAFVCQIVGKPIIYEDMKEFDKIITSFFIGTIIFILTIYFSFSGKDILLSSQNLELNTTILQTIMYNSLLASGFFILVTELFFIFSILLKKFTEGIFKTTIFIGQNYYKPFLKITEIRKETEKTNSWYGGGIWTLLTNVRQYCKNKNVRFSFFLKDNRIIVGYINKYKFPPHLEIEISDAKIISENKRAIKTDTILIPYKFINYYSIDKNKNNKIEKEYPLTFWIIFVIFSTIVFNITNNLLLLLLILIGLVFICLIISKKGKIKELK